MNEKECTLKVSVIMPAYNAERHLVEALNSVIGQTMQSDEFEVIVVNDGSKDTTIDILREFESQYKNVFVIDKENGGPSSARNAGISIAKGETLFFLDADDILENNALEQMYNKMDTSNADLVIAKYDLFDEVRTFQVHNIDHLVLQDDINIFDLEILNTFALWNKLFRRSIVINHSISFSHVSYSEDGVFLFDYLFWCSRITGLNETVIHYRKYNTTASNSITSSINIDKVRDYIEAHHLIKKVANNIILDRYPQYTSIDQALANSIEIKTYCNEIIRKELRILLMNFYPKFWKLDDAVIKMIVSEVNLCIQRIDMTTFASLSENFPNYSLCNLDTDKKYVMKKIIFTVALFGETDHKNQYINSLQSLINQNYIFMRIIVPEHMKIIVEAYGLNQDNIIYCACNSKIDFYETIISQFSDTEYIAICDDRFFYNYNTFSYAANKLNTLYVDFISEVVYHDSYGHMQPVIFSRLVADSFDDGYEYNEAILTDLIFGNKFFRTDFLKIQFKQFDGNEETLIKNIYMKGSFKYLYGQKVLYPEGEESYRINICSKESKNYIERYMDDSVESLFDANILPNQGKSSGKLLSINYTDSIEAAVAKCIENNKNTRPKDQVLFISVRTDDKLDGNLQYLYDNLKGCKRKVICKKLPHDKLVAVKMTKLIISSRVIVTDDYIKYLRYIPLRPQQRVIQLWHAGGAFKKFGIRGTNLPVKTDAATHAQYNLVCVSGKEVRTIYADAFSIEIGKVHALGVPRTDKLFNEDLKSKIKGKIFDSHPEYKGKKILLYAPTFRDIGRDRTNFQPDIDFDRLSKSLRPEQILLICPHPLMENSILEKSYSNINVCRDYATQDYMLVSDLLITDYSSVIFDYALLDKPVIFFCYDLITYNRGFYIKYPDDLPGPVFTKESELIEYLSNLEDYSVTIQYRDFRERYMAACDGKSSVRICKLIEDYMKKPYLLMTDKYINLKKRLENSQGAGKLLKRFLTSLEGFYE